MPSRPPAVPALRQLRSSDLRGVARLATQATRGISRVAEGVHQSVLGTMGLPGGQEPGRARGLTGLVYEGVRGITRLVDAGLQATLLRLEPLIDRDGDGVQEVPRERLAVLAALNGVMGDRLVEDHNPLATPMGFFQHGRPVDLAALGAAGAASGHLVVLVHGLCMNDLQWAHAGHDHGAHLARALGCTSVYLRYNTGLHTSTNGAQLARQLQAMVEAWPVPVTRLSIVGHSMGGLVARSACQQAQEAGLPWRGLLQHLVCLGTPHHGAPLERAGHWVDALLGSTPYSRPFARLARLRSGGITDLRYGHVLDTDWQGRDRFRKSPDVRTHLPLPEGVLCCTVAATLAAKRSPVAERLVGDGLVPLHSALGWHDDPARRLAFAPAAQCVVHRTGHLQLLGDTVVAEQLVQWLQARAPAG
jgi:pimeloyl-ACP methyl ester carboxylesterase